MDIRMKTDQTPIDKNTMLQPKGGSEILYDSLMQKLDDSSKDNINLILSVCDYKNIDKDKINVVWQHLSYDQPNVELMADPNFVEKVDHFVFVSHWQYEKFRRLYNIPAIKSTVIQNAIDPVVAEEKSKYQKIKLIYTSTPWRGLDILLDVFENLDNKNIELDIYSSTKIYGDEFDREYGPKFEPLFQRANNMINVNYHGYVSNEEIRVALSKSDIFAYPSTYEETSCLSAIEALAAGCQVVTTSLGALPETCGTWAEYVTIGVSREILIERYANLLSIVIDNYKNKTTTEKLKDQVDYYNKYWTWEKTLPKWKKLFNNLRKEK
jgi:glycosyltransferase involved in cell wall biosynthesis